MPRKSTGWHRDASLYRDGHAWPEPEPAAWEMLVREMGLTEDEAADDPRAVSWIRQNYRKFFVPEPILEYLGLYLTDREMGFIDWNASRNAYRNHAVLGATQRDSL